MRAWFAKMWNTARDLTLKGQDWARRHLPPGLRLLVGLLLMAGGLIGPIIPFLGVWMLPLGAAIAALDIRPLYRWITGARQYLPEAWRRKTDRGNA
ncbi:hypothetical protein P1J78_05100 [Psychromarinibacter sp. C21-152]|uniref:Transmembrane protein (PGPGW) n=1 Tax=Psychromarinibacter sediminicola TaxID=3033385 RepID=A0AAE3NQ91_9RHOB|nr:hypothetical protein [Psychromarinibacter sediminicola]MDF0600101.1 hypothetical protein [Psychromarinibacter sediminicola]